MKQTWWNDERMGRWNPLKLDATLEAMRQLAGGSPSPHFPEVIRQDVNAMAGPPCTACQHAVECQHPEACMPLWALVEKGRRFDRRANYQRSNKE